MIEELIKLEIKTFFHLLTKRIKKNDTEKYLIYYFFEISKHVRERAEKGLMNKRYHLTIFVKLLNDDKVPHKR